MFRIGAQASAGIVMRAASGVPVPGYFDLQNGALVAGDTLHTVRLPAYVRLDGRAQRRVFSSRHQVTLFAELVNALNRGNEGVATGVTQAGYRRRHRFLAAAGAAAGVIRDHDRPDKVGDLSICRRRSAASPFSS